MKVREVVERLAEVEEELRRVRLAAPRDLVLECSDDMVVVASVEEGSFRGAHDVRLRVLRRVGSDEWREAEASIAFEDLERAYKGRENVARPGYDLVWIDEGPFKGERLLLRVVSPSVASQSRLLSVEVDEDLLGALHRVAEASRRVQELEGERRRLKRALEEAAEAFRELKELGDRCHREHRRRKQHPLPWASRDVYIWGLPHTLCSECLERARGLVERFMEHEVEVR